MSKVTHLSENFYEDFAVLTARLQSTLTWKEYEKFYQLLQDKKLAKATRFLENVNEDRGMISFYTLANIREESSAWNIFYRTVNEMIDDWERFFQASCDWIVLMSENGGSKRAGKLVRQKRKELPAQAPPFIPTPKATVPVKVG